MPKEIITGRASSRETNASIVVVGFPSLTIEKPRNETYFLNTSLLLRVDTDGAGVWYNLDGGTNVTFTDDELEEERTYFNTSNGGHKIYVFANNSGGDVTKRNVSFYVSPGLHNVSYSKYTGYGKGSSTNFNDFSYNELQNLSNVTLEHVSHGKIKFNAIINVIDDGVPGDGVSDIDNNLNISFNEIFLNSTALSNFNKSATLNLYGLTFTNPRMLMNGKVCPSTTCTVNAYTEDGNLSFNVTHFTTFSSEETPVGAESGNGGTAGSSGSGGGGGSGATAINKDFSVDKENIRFSLKQGEIKTEQFSVENIGDSEIKIKVSTELDDFLRISEREFSLKSGEKRVVDVDFVASEKITPDIYLGKIFIEGGEIKREILVSGEVESKVALFDVKVSILDKSLEVTNDEEVITLVEIFNLERVGLVDVKIIYEIRDFEGNVVLEEEESVGVETRTSINKIFSMPKNAPVGKYIIYVRVDYDGRVASSSVQFEVVKKSLLSHSHYFTGIAVGVALILFLYILYELARIRKHDLLYHKLNKYSKGKLKKRRI